MDLFAVIIGFIIIFSAVIILQGGLLGPMDTHISDSIEKNLIEILNKLTYPYDGFHNPNLLMNLPGNPFLRSVVLPDDDENMAPSPN